MQGDNLIPARIIFIMWLLEALEEKRQADLQREQLSEIDGNEYGSESASGTTEYGQSAADVLKLSHRRELEDRLARLLIVRSKLHTTCLE